MSAKHTYNNVTIRPISGTLLDEFLHVTAQKYRITQECVPIDTSNEKCWVFFL